MELLLPASIIPAVDLELIFVLHLASTFVMMGIIWFIQVVHYPLLNRLTRDSMQTYYDAHIRPTTFVVLPPMVIELITGLILLLIPNDIITFRQAAIGLALLLIIWLSTMLLHVPKHRVLATGYDAVVHHALVRSNWIRTLAWSCRGVLVAYAIWF